MNILPRLTSLFSFVSPEKVFPDIPDRKIPLSQAMATVHTETKRQEHLRKIQAGLPEFLGKSMAIVPGGFTKDRWVPSFLMMQRPFSQKQTNKIRGFLDDVGRIFFNWNVPETGDDFHRITDIIRSVKEFLGKIDLDDEAVSPQALFPSALQYARWVDACYKKQLQDGQNRMKTTRWERLNLHEAIKPKAGEVIKIDDVRSFSHYVDEFVFVLGAITILPLLIKYLNLGPINPDALEHRTHPSLGYRLAVDFPEDKTV